MAGRWRSHSWRASTWSGSGRPATAAAALSSAPCRSGWSATACWCAGTPSMGMPPTSPHAARAHPGTATSAPPSTLDMLVAFRRAMLAEYHPTHPAQPTGTKLTDALLTWDVTAA
jgi:hypothetical protein